ncbi:MAG TPA: helix-turn-helix domain-containing protein [Candidatus Binatia bacterium]|nr:helix-turn-helix domain-containing protein [Candidatus Binatia bacterium]
MACFEQHAATLRQWLVHGTPRQRQIAAIVTERQRGTVIDAIAAQLGIHRETVRRWLARYQQGGLGAIERDSRRPPVRRTFDDQTRAAIQGAATNDSGVVWSLVKLRAHLKRTHVVRDISPERLRQILLEMNGRPRSWRGDDCAPVTLVPEEREQLGHMQLIPALRARATIVLAAAADDPIKAIAADLNTSQTTVRRWIARYREGGVRALFESRRYGEPVVFTAETRQRIRAVAQQSPRAFGLYAERWSLAVLRQHLVQQHVVNGISKEWLRQILREGGIALLAEATLTREGRTPATHSTRAGAVPTGAARRKMQGQTAPTPAAG